MRGMCICLLALSVCSSALARDVYVNNITGDDHNTGVVATLQGGLFGPVRSLEKAARVARPHDRIVLENTGLPYSGTFMLSGRSHCGSVGQPLIVEGNGSTLDGRGPIPVEHWENHQGNLFRFRPGWKSTQTLFAANTALTHVAWSPETLALEPMQWTHGDGWVYFSPEAGKLPQDYPLLCGAMRSSICLYRVHDVEIRNLTVLGCALDGIHIADDAKRIVLDNVVLQGNGRAGVYVGGSSRVHLVGVQSSGNRVTQFMTSGVCTVVYEAMEVAPADVQQQGGTFLPLSATDL